jgi:SAM-dependent MidA family methyltransferase
MNPALPEPDAAERAHSAALRALIREEIATHGPMPFSRYMERCLYAPGLGYYSAGRTKFGAAGDFVTAPELGSLFAGTVATRLAPTLRALGADAGFVELGGGSGAFAVDCLAALAAADAVPRRYAILEPSADLAARQRARVAAGLPPALAARVEWISRPPGEPWCGVVFANEVVDALPATRFAILDDKVFEEHVAEDAGRFVSTDRPADALVAAAVRGVERSLQAPFADGYRSEILPQLPYWIAAVLGSLVEGMALLVDYGYARHEYYLPERRDGTLVCHYRHRAHADPMILPGLQDITAFVDFTALADAAAGAGFEVAACTSQATFLLHAGLPERFAALTAGADELERYRLAREVKQLTLPGAMGERFRCLVLTRG